MRAAAAGTRRGEPEERPGDRRERKMPTYVYECERCHHRFELLQGITDPPRQRCPRCRGKVRRLLTSGGGLVFRGTGFYETDYKRKERRPSEETGSTESSKREGAASDPGAAKGKGKGDAGPGGKS
jgi:putative FmdB family regulatory protein